MSIEPVSSARPSEIEHVEWALRDGALADRGFIVFVCRVTVVEAPVKDKGEVPSGVIGEGWSFGIFSI